MQRKYLSRYLIILTSFILTLTLHLSSVAAMREPQSGDPDRTSIKRVGPERVDVAQLNQMNRVHRRSNIWMNITNYGFFGNDGETTGGMDDPCRPGEWAPQCEYPGGSDIQYLFQGALWMGAMIRAEGYYYPRVSVGTDGWNASINELNPGEGATNSQESGIIERSTLPLEFDCLGNYIGGYQDSAISEQDFVCSYSDTLTDNFWLDDDAIDGPHVPLGIKVTQKTYTWTYNYAQNFIIMDWEVENIASNYLRNLYIGLYIDADVGKKGNRNRHTDDICGFQKWFYYERPDGGIDSSVINTAYISDNDGRHQDDASGSNFEAPGVMGARVVRAPNPKLKTSFNWWVSNTNADLDFGPSWQDDDAPGSWTATYGTPEGDERKYFVLKNREFDFDQVFTGEAQEDSWIQEHPQIFRDRFTNEETERHYYKQTTDDDARVEDGFDTRYLLSWGPLGIFDQLDPAGNRVYRLNPGEKFSMTVAMVAGNNFHDRNNPQPSNENIDPELFDFSSLRYNADWAARVYDNPMIDTPVHDWGYDHLQGTNDPDGSEGDGFMDTGDGWYGEDVGNDGLFAEEIGDDAYKWEGGIRVLYEYPGPDPDGTENDGHLSQVEDALERPFYLEYTMFNEMLDFGDGHPDFKGPPPPDAPRLQIISEPFSIDIISDQSPFVVNNKFTVDDDFLTDNVVIKWNSIPSEISQDPFSREIDFEGYRIYVSNVFIENEFSFLDNFDRVDYAMFSLHDSMGTKPVTEPDSLPEADVRLGVRMFRQPVGPNQGLHTQGNFIADTSTHDNSVDYYYIIENAHPMVPRYYAVTAYDYGDYKTGTEPLESARIANAVYAAPSGTDAKKVGVVPNPYRANADYTVQHGGLAWENRDDGTSDFFPQTDRRLYFYNLPEQCLIRIYTLSGDLVVIVPHNVSGDVNLGWNADFAEPWDLNSRNKQQVVSGVYLFTVEDMTTENKGDIETGKFVVIR